MRRLVAALTVCLALFGCSALSGCSPGLQQLPIGRSAEGSDYRVVAEFARADRIRLGTEVRMGQQLLGRVHDLSTDGLHAQVGLSLSSSIPIPAEVTASIELPSALGEPYVQLIAPSAPSTDLLSEGAIIEDTEIGPELESSLAALGLVLNGSGLDQLQTIMTEMNDAFAGRGPEIRGLLHSADDIMAAASTQQTEFDRVLAAAGSVADALADNRARIDAGLTLAAPTVELLVRQQDRIASLVDSTASLASNARKLLADNATRLDTGIGQVSDILASIRGFNESVTPALANMNEFIAGFNGAVHGDYLVFDGALDLPETLAELVTGGRAVGVPQTLEQLLIPGTVG